MRHLTWLRPKILIVIFFIFSMYLPGGLSAETQNIDESNGSENQGGVPRIQFNELSYDFGKSFEDQTLEHIFSFKNIGTGSLQIVQVKAG